MKQHDQDAYDKFQMLITRLGTLAIIAILAFGVTRLKNLDTTNKRNDQKNDSIYVETIDEDLERKIRETDIKAINEVLKEKKKNACKCVSK